MNILLIDPLLSPFSWNQEPAPPLGLLYLASAIKNKLYGIQNVHDVHVLSLQASKFFYKEGFKVTLNRTIKSFQPDIVGISTPTPSTPNALAIAKIIRQSYSPAKIIVGGYQASADLKSVLVQDVDIAVRGEGEIPFCEIIALAETKDWTKIQNIKGIGFKGQTGSIIITPPRARITNIDTLPFPDRQIVPMDLFKTIGNTFRAGGIISSRGCSWSCNFCYSPVLWGGISYRSPKSIVDEIELLIKDYQINKIRFEDDTFTVNQARVIAICDEIGRRGLQIEWEARTRVDLASEKMLEKMRTSGLQRLQVGVETIEDDSLTRYKKQTNFSKYENFFSKIRNAGIGLIITVIVGLPSETPEQMKNTIEWVQERLTANDRFIRCMYTPFPGTFIDGKLHPEILSGNLAQYTMDIPLVTSDLFSLEQLLEVKEYADRIMKKNGPHHAVFSPIPAVMRDSI